MTNIQKARWIADAGSIPHFVKEDGWVGEDSDYGRRYWRIGGNAVVYSDVHGLVAMRWHQFLKNTKGLKYPAR